MKLKYYLRGLGIGIVVTTLLLMISFAKHGTMSDEQVINRAKELGMVMKDTESVFENVTENGTEVAVKGAEKDSEVTTPTENAESSQQVEPQQGEPTQQTEPQQADPIQPQIIEITVTKGEYCRAISEDLASKGLVDDAESFRKYMGQIKYDELVCGGVYQIPVGSTYEQIANILVSGNN